MHRATRARRQEFVPVLRSCEQGDSRENQLDADELVVVGKSHCNSFEFPQLSRALTRNEIIVGL